MFSTNKMTFATNASHSCGEYGSACCRQCYYDALTKVYRNMPTDVLELISEYTTGRASNDPIGSMASWCVYHNLCDLINDKVGEPLLTSYDSSLSYDIIAKGRFIYPHAYSLASCLNITEQEVNRSAIFDDLRDQYLDEGDDESDWILMAWMSDFVNSVTRVPYFPNIFSDEQMTDLLSAPAHAASWIYNATANSIALKALLCSYVLRGQIVRGEIIETRAIGGEQSPDYELAWYLNPYKDLLIDLNVVLWDIYYVVNWIFSRLSQTYVVAKNGFGALAARIVTKHTQSYIIVISHILLLYMIGYLTIRAVYLWRERNVFKLVEGNKKGVRKYIRCERSELGTKHVFVYDGKLVEILEEEKSYRTDEMALPGSHMYPSERRDVGAICVAGETTELTRVGCFFRYENYLITAKHVANQISCGLAGVYLTGPVEAKRGNFKANLTNVKKIDKELFNLENNRFKLSMDVFAIELDPKMWSQLGLNKVSTRLKSEYGMQVSAVGYNDGLLVVSTGKTLRGSGVQELHHTASTLPGFSGSPLYCGKSVVGVHVAADGDKNVAIRIEAVAYQLDRKPESNQTDLENVEFAYKVNGRSNRFHQIDEDEWVSMDQNGRVRYDWHTSDMDRIYNREEEEDQLDIAASKLIARPFVPRKARGVAIPSYNTHVSWADESAIKDYALISKEKPVHCNKTPPLQPVAVQYIEKTMDDLVKLGYDKGKYAWPEINPETEETSLVNHLKLFANNVNKRKMTLFDVGRERIAHVVTKMCENLRYEAPKDYLGKDNLERLLHSSLVKDSKSPGHPYQAMGLMTNEQVLKHYGIDGFVEVIQREFGKGFDLKYFLKGEPAKEKKLKSNMPRGVAGHPLHNTVANAAVFGNFRDSVMKNWRKSPVKYPFSPLVPGHIKHLKECLPGKTYGSDKPNWDFSCFVEFYYISCDVIQELAVQPSDMSDEDFQKYKDDVFTSICVTCENSRFRCTNGSVYKSEFDGIMKSGSLMTIDINSLSQLIFDVAVKIMMGLSDDEIIAMPIVVGGDDVLQSFPDGFSTETYLQKASVLGFDMPEFEVTASFENCEFFSNRFNYVDGVWTFNPERFTKHVENLKTVKLEHLASALSSHMMNHCWNKRRYNYFDKMYKTLRKDHPEDFPLNLLRSQRMLQNNVTGCE